MSLTDKQIERQDEVDGAIMGMVVDLAPEKARDDIEWDIEMIGRIRDEVIGWVCDRLGLMSEEEFYPSEDGEEVDDDN